MINFKSRKRPLWLFHIIYSRMMGMPMCSSNVYIFKKLNDIPIDIDGDTIMGLRRFSKKCDFIEINIFEKYYRVIKTYDISKNHTLYDSDEYLRLLKERTEEAFKCETSFGELEHPETNCSEVKNDSKS